MKRIILFSLLFLQLFAFTQSDIWGVKLGTSLKMDGYLYSIDSITNKILAHQYFTHSINSNGHITRVLFDSTSNLFYGIIDHTLYKYDLIANTVEMKNIDFSMYGDLVKASNGSLYILGNSGVLKIDPISLEFEQFGNLIGELVLPDTTIYFDYTIGVSSDGLVPVSNDKFMFSAFFPDNVFDRTYNYICMLDTQNDTIEVVNKKGSYQDGISLRLQGKFHAYQNKYYALFTEDYKTYLYSYNTSNNEFTLEISVSEDLPIVSYINEIAISNDGILYGLGILNSSESNRVFKYDLQNGQYENLVAWDEISMSPQKINLDHDYNLFFKYSSNQNDSISDIFFKYNNETLSAETVLVYNVRHEDESISRIEERGFNIFQDEFIALAEGFENYVLSFDLEEGSIDTLVHLPKYYLYSDSLTRPFAFFDTPEGNILFFGKYELRDSKGTKQFIRIHEFEPLSNKLSVIKSIPIHQDVYWTATVANKMLDNKCFISAEYDSIIIYDLNTNEFIKKQTPFENSSEWIKQSPSDIMIKPRSENRIYNFNVLNNEFEMIYEPVSDTELVIIHPYEEDKLAIYSSTCDHLFYLDLSSKKTHSILDLNELSVNDTAYYISDFRIYDIYIYVVLHRHSSSYDDKLLHYNMETGEINNLYTDLDMDVTPNLRFEFIRNYRDDGFYIVDNKDDVINESVLRMHYDHSDSLENLGFFDKKITRTMCYNLPFIKARKQKVHRWIGLTSSDWFEETNWDQGKVPDHSSSVSIMRGTAYYPQIDTLIQLENLYINYDAQVHLSVFGALDIQENFKNHGQLIMAGQKQERSSLIVRGEFIQKGRQSFHFSSDSLIENILSNPFFIDERLVSPPYQEAVFNANESIWDPILFYPYQVDRSQVYKYYSDSSEIEFKGKFETKPVSLIIHQLSQASIYPLPNPYPSAINWQKIEHSTLSHKACYFYDENENSFSAYVDGLGNHSPIIRPLEGFWVWTEGEERIELDKSVRVHENEYVEELPQKKFVNIQVSGEKGKDIAVIGFNENASFEFDPEYDAFKFVKSTNFAPHVFTKSGDELFTVNQIPDTSMFDLYVRSGKNETLNISLDKINNLDFLVLEDLIWNTRTDLLKETYSFDYFSSDGNYPFKLYFKPWALEPIEELDIQMYYYPEYLVIKSRKPVDYAVITFYDLAGREALKFDEHDFFHIQKPIQIPTGHYIVQFRSGDLVINKKVLVR